MSARLSWRPCSTARAGSGPQILSTSPDFIQGRNAAPELGIMQGSGLTESLCSDVSPGAFEEAHAALVALQTSAKTDLRWHNRRKGFQESASIDVCRMAAGQKPVTTCI